jgi:hypothetical protein
VLVFLLFLLAASTRNGVARYVGPIVAGLFGLYGAASYVTGVPRILREHIADPTSGLTVRATSPAALAYIRGREHLDASQEAAPPTAVVPVQVVTNLPGFRIIPVHLVESTRWSGRVGKIYVVPRSDALSSARFNNLLSAFANYDRRSWQEIRFGEFVVFSQ